MKVLTLAVLALGLTLGATGCKKKTPADSGTGTPSTATQPAADGEEARQGLPDPNAAERTTLGKVYFELDMATLSEEAKATLAENADVLSGNASVTVRVEGHADERGSTQYNIALGMRRATAVQNYLSSLGVATSRMEVVSYGEEKPAVQGGDESAWSRNRRVELAVTAGGDLVSSSY